MRTHAREQVLAWASVGAAAVNVGLSLIAAREILEAGEKKGSVPAAQPTSFAFGLDRPNALMLAKRSQTVLIGLGVTRDGSATVVAWAGSTPLHARTITVMVNGRLVSQPACGGTCAGLTTAAFKGRPTSLFVQIAPPGRPAVAETFQLPGRFPAAAGERLRQAQRRMLALRSAVVSETLSNGSAQLRARFEMERPSSLRITSSAGSRSIQIGPARWTSSGGTWTRADTQPLRMPAFAWDRASRAFVLGTTRSRGSRLTTLSAFDPGSGPAWFRLLLNRRDEIAAATMFAPAHFMVDRVVATNTNLQIRPPE